MSKDAEYLRGRAEAARDVRTLLESGWHLDSDARTCLVAAEQVALMGCCAVTVEEILEGTHDHPTD